MSRAFFTPFGKTCHVFLPMLLAKDVAHTSRQAVTLLYKLYLLSSFLAMFYWKYVPTRGIDATIEISKRCCGHFVKEVALLVRSLGTGAVTPARKMSESHEAGARSEASFTDFLQFSFSFLISSGYNNVRKVSAIDAGALDTRAAKRLLCFSSYFHTDVV
jgi:hypothetical protein